MREEVKGREEMKKRFKALMRNNLEEKLRKLSEALKKKKRMEEKSVSFLLPSDR